MLRVVGFFLLIVFVGLAAFAGSVYLYLSPEEPAARISAPSSLRTTSDGEIIGFQGKYNAHTWLGLPYAQPPIGDLRWKAPRPLMPSTVRREALNYGSSCVQLPVLPNSDDGKGYLGSEDCLVLNIWAPTFGPTKVPKADDRLPVMFWIHGGGNSMGSGGSERTEFYDGSFLATEHNVIVVTVNYRMGPLGWFAHDALMETAVTPEDASANFGTLDLIAALKWVQQNIGYFGGDASNVTIFGESAGGSNVLSLMASPLATGLFQRAIAQSSALNIHSMDEAQQIGIDSKGHAVLSSREVVAGWLVKAGRAANREVAIAMQDEMSPEELALWLRELSSGELYENFDASFAGMIAMPMIFSDGYVLLDSDVSNIFEDPANYSNVPLMIGSTRDETKLFMAASSDYVERSGRLITGIRDLEAYNRDTGYGTDIWRAEGTDRIAELISADHPDKVFAYRFDADDWRNFGFIDLKNLLGAAHVLEIPFIFGYFPPPSKILFPDSTFDEIQLLSGAMMSYWTEFAHNGDPGRGRNEEEPLWRPWRDSNGSGHYLLLDTDIDAGIRMTQGVLTRDEVKQKFLADTSFKSDEARCLGYRSAFFNVDFNQDEYESIGCQ